MSDPTADDVAAALSRHDLDGYSCGRLVRARQALRALARRALADIRRERRRIRRCRSRIAVLRAGI